MAKRKESEIIDLEEPETIPPIPTELLTNAAEQSSAIKSEPQAAMEQEATPAASAPAKAEPEKKKEPKSVAAAAQPKPSVQLSERGTAGALDIDQAYRLALALFQGKGFPNWVRSPEQALAVSLFLRNLGLEVMTGVQHVCEVNGRLTLWGEGPLAAVRASGNLKSIKEGFYTKDYEEICFKNKNLDADIHFAYCVTVRKDNGEKKETWFSGKDAETATQGIKAIWTGYRRTMFKRKARAENLKDNFGDVLQGAGVAEYDNESAPDMPPPAAPISLASQMNQVLEDKRGEEVQAQ